MDRAGELAHLRIAAGAELLRQGELGPPLRDDAAPVPGLEVRLLAAPARAVLVERQEQVRHRDDHAGDGPPEQAALDHHRRDQEQHPHQKRGVENAPHPCDLHVHLAGADEEQHADHHPADGEGLVSSEDTADCVHDTHVITSLRFSG